MRYPVGGLLIAAAVAFLTSLAADRLLMLWKLPDEFVHPTHYHEHRETIEFSYDFKTNDRLVVHISFPSELIILF